MEANQTKLTREFTFHRYLYQFCGWLHSDDRIFKFAENYKITRQIY